MRRKWITSVLAALGLTLGIIVWHCTGQDAGNRPARTEGSLPISQVVLFNSGVGYFQREGEVVDNARVDLSFPTSDINDLLKSLILQDLSGGKISTVNYDSHDPIDKILRSFALDLNNNPSFAQLLNQARGEKIQYYKGGRGECQTAVIVGIELKKPAAKDAANDVEFVNLSTKDGLISLPLTEMQWVRFLNPVLESEFQRALRVLASSHDSQKKAVSLGFNGQGKRNVRVGYVVEHPIWKTSYRLRIDQGGKVFMQGWAIVENTSDDDWNDVRMVLVSGRPISYKMNMYEPLYIPRPEVEPELFASLRPPVHGGALLNQGQAPWVIGSYPYYEYPRPFAGGPAPGYGGPPPGYGGPWPPPGYNGPPPPGYGAPPPGAPLNAGGNADGLAPNATASQQYGYNTQPNNMLGERREGIDKLSYDELRRRRLMAQQMQDKARKEGAAIAGLNFKEGIASVASAEEVGDYYQYVVDQKITLPRQKSAMLPILDQTIDGAKVSIYNEATHAKYPLLGLRIKNSSKQPLSQGPITVYEEGSYAGDTRILDLQPGEVRFLSYALDQAVEVKSVIKNAPGPDMTLTIDATCQSANYKMRQTRTYTIKNRAAHDRTVILEHPIQGRQPEAPMVPAGYTRPPLGSAPANWPPPDDNFMRYGPQSFNKGKPVYREAFSLPPTTPGSCEWKLVEPKKPMETTRDLYRFQVQVPAGKTVTFDAVEEQERADQLVMSLGSFCPVGDAGIQVKAMQVFASDELKSLKIVKGMVTPTIKTRVSKTYFVQNNTDVDRALTVDHIVCAEWVRQVEDGESQKGPAVYRFVLPIAKGKTAQREIIEEKTCEAKASPLHCLSEETLLSYINSKAVDKKVKATLTMYMAANRKVAEVQQQLDAQDQQLKLLSGDQARLRENLKIIPQSSEPYKKFLEKFVAQETQIENHQKQVRQLQASVQQQLRDIETAFGPMPQPAPGAPAPVNMPAPDALPAPTQPPMP